MNLLVIMYLFISVLQGGAQVVVMDWISVLDHKHLPSAHSGAPCRTLHSLVYLAQAGMKVLLQTQNPTLKTLVVVPPAGRTNSLLSSSGTPSETCRFLRCGDTKWAQCGVGSALELMVLSSRAQTSVFEVFVFICYRPFSSAFEERAVTVYSGDSMVTFFPPPAACGAPGSA